MCSPTYTGHDDLTSFALSSDHVSRSERKKIYQDVTVFRKANPPATVDAFTLKVEAFSTCNEKAHTRLGEDGEVSFDNLSAQESGNSYKKGSSLLINSVFF